MRQRGFTLLEMMLILLLIGVSAGMVMLAFPASRDDSAAQALARFEAQLRFVQQRGLQTGQFFGASVHPDRWQFLVLQPRESNEPPPAGDDWNGYRWLPCAPDASPLRAASPGTRCISLFRRARPGRRATIPMC